jgi:hypothetical protein
VAEQGIPTSWTLSRKREELQMPTETAVEEVRKNLGTIIKLLAAQIKPDLPMSQRAPLLDRLGVDYDVIASVCSTTPNVIRARVAEARKAAGGRAPRKNSKQAKAPVAQAPTASPAGATA